MNNQTLLKIRESGQSIWMDHLDRKIIQSGELQQMVESGSITGLTSNPIIFQKAIAGSDLYNSDLEQGVRTGKSAGEIYESLVLADIRNACDIFRPVYDATQGLDGYVSIEVSPKLAHDTQATIDEARRFYRALERPNVMLKIPGTAAGFPAVEQVIADGINVNITLLFSVDSYVKSAEAYMRGLERRVEQGQPIDRIASVASFFLSRIDTNVDQRLQERLKQIGTETLNQEARLSQILGKVAIANAKVAYQTFKQITASERWQALAAKGANVQRLLWASTSTKNPDYNDVMYVNELIGQNTVNTMPPSTIEACADHCEVISDRIESGVSEAYQLLDSLNDPDVQIDLNTVMNEVMQEGIDKFVQPFDSLMQSIADKMKQLTGATA
jgi:transaldolase